MNSRRHMQDTISCCCQVLTQNQVEVISIKRQEEQSFYWVCGAVYTEASRDSVNLVLGIHYQPVLRS